MSPLASVLVALSLIAPAPQEEPEGDLAKLQGTWKAEDVGPMKNVTLVMTIEGQRVEYVAQMEGRDDQTIEAELTLDETTEPKQLTFNADSEQIPDFLGIYTLDGDTLVIRGSVEQRPTEFDEESLEQITYKRQKDEDDGA